MDLVIGLSSYPAGGKDFIADLIAKKYHFFKVSPGEIIRKLMKKEKIEINRENEVKYSTMLRKKNGSEFIMKLCYEHAKEEGASKIVIAGVRTLGDLRFFRDASYIFFKNIFISAPAKLRYERSLKRERDDSPRSFEEFLKEDKLEEKTFNLSKIKLASDFILVNKEKEKMEKNLDKIMKKILEEYKKYKKE
ncbi:MAG: hypothetical protein OH318_00870 [Candidatus Parvarchaeota archaeon]|nr:hypothetical protein [Candidatus Rehaiarchaeum fermentans]